MVGFHILKFYTHLENLNEEEFHYSVSEQYSKIELHQVSTEQDQHK